MGGDLLCGLAAVAMGEPETARPLLERSLRVAQEKGANAWTRQARVGLAFAEGKHGAVREVERQQQYLEEAGFRNVAAALRYLHPLVRTLE